MICIFFYNFKFLNSEMSGYIGGNIVRIKMKHFMTYDEVEIFPKKGLNLVLGLNGTGKSTLMCAICLALGGKTQFTGRSNTIADYIQHTHDEAMVEVELENTRGRNLTVRRIIQEDKSIWFINDNRVTISEVLKAVGKYNIDVGNLCQFLPQEKVVEFSKMDKKQRLENMLKAIGDNELSELFEELKGLQKQVCELDGTLQSHQRTKASEQQKNERLQAEVDRHAEQVRLKHEHRTLLNKRLILKYNEKRFAMKATKQELRALDTEKESKENEIKILNDEKSKVVRQFLDYTAEITDLRQKLGTLMAKINKNRDELDKSNEEVENAKIEFRNKIQEKNNQKAKLAELEIQIRGLEELLDRRCKEEENSSESVTRISSELENVKRNICELSNQIMKLNQECVSIDYKTREYKHHISKLQDEKNKKMLMLKQKHPMVFQAVTWFEQNRAMFKREICPPPILSLNVKHDENRKYIESSIPKRDLLAFVCEDPDDCKKLAHILKNELRLKVNVVMAPSQGVVESPVVTPAMERLGIICFIKDLFEAPELIMRYFCTLYGINKIPLCHEDAANNMNRIFEIFGFFKFYTPTETISSKRSRYGDKLTSTKRQPIWSSNILPSSNEKTEELQKWENLLKADDATLATLKQQLDDLKQKSQEWEKLQEKLRNERAELTRKDREFRDLKMRYKQKTDMYNRKKREVVDEDAEKNNLTNVVRKANAEKLCLLSDNNHLLKEFVRLKETKLKILINSKSLSRIIAASSSEIQDKNQKLIDLRGQVDAAKATLLKEKNEGLAMLNEIQVKMRDEGLTGDMVQGDTLDSIDSKLAHVQAQLDLNSDDNEAVQQEFNKRAEEIELIGKRIEASQEQLLGLRQEVEVRKQLWLPPLLNHIAGINRNFSQHYKRLKCAGEICLDQTEDPDNFSGYGLAIRLQYRDDEPLQELSQTHHSGGECSVAAIVFILSLHDCTEVPFRCIDEINQGMDSRNERMVYDLITESVLQQGSSSQYFLLTPKLLLDINYQGNICIHSIFNSSHLLTKIDVKRERAIRHSNNS